MARASFDRIALCLYEGGDMLFDRRLGFSGTPSDLLPVELGKCEYERGILFFAPSFFSDACSHSWAWQVRTVKWFISSPIPLLPRSKSWYALFLYSLIHLLRGAGQRVDGQEFA